MVPHPRPAALGALALVLVSAAGCFGGDDGGQGMVRITGTVTDTKGTPLAARVELDGAGAGAAAAGAAPLATTADPQGAFSFRLAPVAQCVLRVGMAGHAQAVQPLDCSEDRSVAVRLRPLLDVGGTPGDPGGGGGGGSGGPGDGRVWLRGLVADAATGDPVRAEVSAAPAAGTAAAPARTLAAADGAYALALAPGAYIVTASSGCHDRVAQRVQLDADLALDILLMQAGGSGGLPAPAVQATSGPGPGMVTFHWEAVPGAATYTLLGPEGGAGGLQPVTRLGNSTAYGVHAVAPVSVQVAAVRACGAVGEPSPAVTGTPLQGAAAVALPPAVTSANHPGEVRSYPVLDASLAPAGTRSWMVVPGTGNCCENYIATTQRGDILDLGGENIAWSPDNGTTWSTVRSPLVLLTGEGAIAAAPDGDIVAVSWATYNADTLFSFKYSAATKTWLHQVVPAHAPVYDRPWIGTLKGPFEVGGLVVPYVTVVHGGPVVKEPMLVSLDGLHYRPFSQLAEPLSGSIGVALALGDDPDRDWTAPLGEFPLTPLGNGQGLYGRAAAIGPDTVWRRTSLPGNVPAGLLRADSRGGLHVMDVDADGARYHFSHDGGATWGDLVLPVPEGASFGEWDVRVHAALGQAVFTVNADEGGRVQQYAYRLRGIGAEPYLDEVLLVGDGQGAFGSGIGEGGNRFDFMSSGLLPDGRLVMSMGDSTADAPQMAIEM